MRKMIPGFVSLALIALAPACALEVEDPEDADVVDEEDVDIVEFAAAGNRFIENKLKGLGTVTMVGKTKVRGDSRVTYHADRCNGSFFRDCQSHNITIELDEQLFHPFPNLVFLPANRNLFGDSSYIKCGRGPLANDRNVNAGCYVYFKEIATTGSFAGRLVTRAARLNSVFRGRVSGSGDGARLSGSFGPRR